jgi:hypothetical protein
MNKHIFLSQIQKYLDKVAVRFDILTVMLLRIQVFLDMKLCCWVSGSQRSAGPHT